MTALSVRPLATLRPRFLSLGPPWVQIELVFSATEAGFLVNVIKSRLGPGWPPHAHPVSTLPVFTRHRTPCHVPPPMLTATIIKFLGTIIDSWLRVFRLPRARVERLSLQVRELRTEVTEAYDGMVSARSIASVIGLLWAASPCAPRAVAIMARGMVASYPGTSSASHHLAKERPRDPAPPHHRSFFTHLN